MFIIPSNGLILTASLCERKLNDHTSDFTDPHSPLNTHYLIQAQERLLE